MEWKQGIPNNKRFERAIRNYIGVSKNRGVSPKMDGENNGKSYEQMGWFGGKTHYFRKHPYGWNKCLVDVLCSPKVSPAFTNSDLWSNKKASFARRLVWGIAACEEASTLNTTEPF